MKTLMKLSSDIEIKCFEGERHIYVSCYNPMFFCDAAAVQVSISVCFIEGEAGDCFGVMSSSVDSTSWSVHMSTEEAMQLHALLPNVAFKDERVSAAESLTDIGGAA